MGARIVGKGMGNGKDFKSEIVVPWSELWTQQQQRLRGLPGITPLTTMTMIMTITMTMTTTLTTTMTTSTITSPTGTKWSLHYSSKMNCTMFWECLMLVINHHTTATNESKIISRSCDIFHRNACFFSFPISFCKNLERF